ncbi:RNA-directed DNA polymerase [Tanacetum coccineum]|uniref:RNA-directed DNA polymerase n=1 Tax=Tanacetum coccineum TaxID=301880 RepID=A0ABQ4ZP07_9ASTR
MERSGPITPPQILSCHRCINDMAMVILPKSNQTILDAPDGFVLLYTQCFSLANLRLALPKFFCDVLHYYHVHLSRLNPVGYAKLTTFVVMCKAYGVSIVPRHSLKLLSKDNMMDKKSFKDKFPLQSMKIRYFSDLEGILSMNFMYAEPPLVEAEPLDVAYPEQLVENTTDSGGSPPREEMLVFVSGSSIPNKPAYRMNPKEYEELQRQVTKLLEKGSSIPNKPAYRMNPKEYEELQRQVTKLLEKVSALMVPKHGGAFRMCFDSRVVNKITIKYCFPIPRFDDLLDQLYGSSMFSKIDLRSGYHQIRMRPGDECNTAFKTRDGLYEWIAVDEHLSHLCEVFSVLKEQKVYANRNKCHFLVNEVTFLGYVITGQGIRMDKSKIEAILNWPLPTTLHDIRSFHGLASFYRPTKAFELLKVKVTEAPVLCLPNFNDVFQVECDASGVGIGGVLSQNKRPIAFFSEKLNEACRKYSTYDKEFYAIIRSLDTWRHYLLANEFVLFSDHEA